MAAEQAVAVVDAEIWTAEDEEADLVEEEAVVEDLISLVREIIQTPTTTAMPEESRTTPQQGGWAVVTDIVPRETMARIICHKIMAGEILMVFRIVNIEGQHISFDFLVFI